METFILKQIDNDLKNYEINHNLSQPNLLKIENEFELRFGRIDKSRFDPLLPKTQWMSIFNKIFKTDTTLNKQIIIDRNHWDNQLKCKMIEREQIIIPTMPKSCILTNTDSFKILKTNKINNINISVPRTWHSKTRQQNITIDNLRYNHSIEKLHEPEKVNPAGLKKLNIRFKHRFSKLITANVRCDMTIIDVFNTQRNSGNPGNFGNFGNSCEYQFQRQEYIVELEIIDYCPKLHRSILFDFGKVVAYINDIIWDETHFFLNQRVIQAHSITKKHLSLIDLHEYSVTDKADGVRILLIFLNNHIYLQNPNTSEIIETLENKTNLNYTIIDGEWIAAQRVFLAFDLLFYCRNSNYLFNSLFHQNEKNHKHFIVDVRQYVLKKRIEILKEIVSGIKYPQNSKKLNIQVKKYYNLLKKENVFTKSLDIWSMRRKLFKYDIDGLIFTPNTHYLYNSKLPVIKWKDKITIDVRVEYYKQLNFTYFHHSTERKHSKEWVLHKPNVFEITKNTDTIKHLRWCSNAKHLIKAYSNKNIGCENNNYGRKTFYLGKMGPPAPKQFNVQNKWDIVEYVYDFCSESWTFYRKRTTNKQKPNSYYTIKNNLDCIIEPITIEEIKNFDANKNCLNEVGEQYDFISTYCNKVLKRKKWRYYNNYVKKILLQQFRNKNYEMKVDDFQEQNNRRFKPLRKNTNIHCHLDLGCGKLGDLNKYINCGYDNIIAVDSSIEALNEAIQRLNTNPHFHTEPIIELDLQIPQNSDMYNTMWVHKDGLKIMLIHADVTKNLADNKQFKELLRCFGKQWQGFDSCSCMFAIHYFVCFGKQFMKNITRLLKHKGIFFGIYLNGDKIKQDFLEFRGEKNELIYSIKTIQSNGDDLDSLEISTETWSQFCNVKITEPKINSKIVGELIEGYDFQKIMSGECEIYYDKFTNEFDFQLTETEKKLCFLNNVFAYEYNKK